MKRFLSACFPSAIPRYHPRLQPRTLKNVFLNEHLPHDATDKHAATVERSKCDNKLVLLLGWGGSQRRNLSKVIDFYNSEGLDVVSVTMPLGIPAFLRHYVEDLTAAELSIYRQKYGSSELNIHSFSNNGIWVYGSMSKRGILPAHRKVVLDSAPFFHFAPYSIFFEAQVYTKVFTSSLLKKNVYEHPVLSPTLRAVFAIAAVICRFIESIQGSTPIIEDFIKLNTYIRDQSPGVPHLFVYSEGDELLPAPFIRSFRDALRARNVDVTECVFGCNVPHVGGFYIEPDTYKQKLRDFFEF